MSTVKGTREKCNFSVQTVKCDAKKRAMMGRRYNRELIVLRYRTISSIREGKKICGTTQMTPVDRSGLFLKNFEELCSNKDPRYLKHVQINIHNGNIN